MNIFKRKPKVVSTPILFETDSMEDVERYKDTPGIMISYHAPRTSPPPMTLVYKDGNGNEFSKYNPEYIKYLQDKHGITRHQAFDMMREELDKAETEEEEEHTKSR